MKKQTIEFYSMESEEMKDAIDRMVVEVHTKKKQTGKKTILLSGCGSSTGVTFLSINLSIALANAGWKTLLVDCDLRKTTKYKRVGEEITLGLSEYLDRKAKKEEILQLTNHDQLTFIGSGNNPKSPVSLLCSELMDELFFSLSKEYDYVILDSPSLTIVSDNQLLFPYVDGVILVAALNVTTKKQIADAKKIIAQDKEKYYGLVVNMVSHKQYQSQLKDVDYFRITNLEKKHTLDMKKINKKDKGLKKVEKEEKINEKNHS